MPRHQGLVSFILECLEDPKKALAKSAPKVLDRIHPEAGQVARVALAIGQKSAGVMRLDTASQNEFMRSLKEQGWGVYPIMGLQGSGKTVLAIWLADYISNPNNYEIGMRPDQRPAWAHSLNNIQELLTLPAHSTVILDDVSQLISIYGYGDKRTNQALTDAIALCRHKQLTIIATGQATGPVSVRLFETLETFFWKVPPLAADFQRPGVRQQVKAAQQVFYNKSLKWQQSHVFVWSTRFIGVMEYDARAVAR